MSKIHNNHEQFNCISDTSDIANMENTVTMVTGQSINRLPRLQSANVEEVEISREYKSGAKYVGPVHDNKKIGRGVFVWPSGARYEGEFTDNVRHGKGYQKWADGSWFSGDFVLDLRHGEGDHSWANGEQYTGHFFKDRRHGKGTYVWPDGSSYYGTFYMDKKEGYGTFIFANGNRFQGLYKDDEREGPGVLTYTDGRRDVGLWHRERLVHICSSIEGAFTMKDHPEFDYVAEEHINHIMPRSITNRTEVFHHIINPPEQFNYLRDDNVTPDTDSLFSETLDSRSLAADIQTFDAAFFKDMDEDNNNAVLQGAIQAWNNTPSCMSMQTHILRHRHTQAKQDWNVENVLNGNRGKKEDKGPLEVASERLMKAAAAGDVQTVADLLHDGHVFVDVADKNGHTALLSAAVNWHQDVINCLLDNGADVNKLTNEGMSALAACHVFFYPVDSFCYNIAERYMEKPPDIDTEETDSKKDVKGILSSRTKSQENGSINGDVTSNKSKISLDSGLHDHGESPQDQRLKVKIIETSQSDSVENAKKKKVPTATLR